MKEIFGEVFTKISNGIFIGCLGCILVSWGLYESSDVLILSGAVMLVMGFILAVINEERGIKKSKKSDDKIKKLEKKLKSKNKMIEELQDAVMYLTQDMEIVSAELKAKSVTIERFKKIKLSMLKDNKVWDESEDMI